MSAQARISPVTTGLGWLDGTAKSLEPEGIRSVMSDYFGPPLGEVAASGFFARGEGYDNGRARVEWLGRGSAQGYTRAEVKQSALDGLGLGGSVELLDSLHRAGFRPSRVDLYVDDHERRVTPGRVREAVLGGQAVTHAHPGRHWRDDEDGRETYYLGRAGSDRMIRVYDKLDPDRSRVELQARRDAAVAAGMTLLAADGPPLPSRVMSEVVRFVDFRNSKGRSNGRRAPRLAWWQAVVGDVEKAEAAPIRPRLSLDELGVWFDTTMGKTLAELYRGLGPRWLESVLRRGEMKLDQELEGAEWVA